MPDPSPFPRFENSYGTLPAALHRTVAPYGASAPRLLKLNAPLAEVLGFDLSMLDEAKAADIFSGNRLAKGTEPLAMAYAGHQFGGFNPGLGDGRALLLGEVIANDGERYDIQLKGSGQTPFSRQGDGRAALGPVLREYVVSEAMAALGVPTTRALAAVSTGDHVLRESILPGAMLTRVAASHLRVGTFEFAAFKGDRAMLEALTHYALDRHYGGGTEGLSSGLSPGLALLNGVMERQAELVAQWMGLGFIHGVMNTDNCSIAGQTIDYGPCAFMDGYDRAQVYSAIDHHGRYAYANQPPIAHWNMAVLAQTLLPMIHADEDKAIALAQEAVNRFADLYQRAHLKVMRAKLGLVGEEADDAALASDFLDLLESGGADFTASFRALEQATARFAPLATLGEEAKAWWERWCARLGEHKASIRLMRASNPAIIPRNHRIEAMIAAAMQGDFSPFHAMVDGLASPYEDAPLEGEAALLAVPPAPDEVVRATFCGT